MEVLSFLDKKKTMRLDVRAINPLRTVWKLRGYPSNNYIIDLSPTGL
jgi:hypothetical protein